MKKSELIDRVAEKAETTRAAAARMVEAIFDTTSGAIAEAVKAGSQVSIPGFGRFKPKTRPARKGRNPQTGAEIDIPEKRVVTFSPGRGLQDIPEEKGGATRAGKQRKAPASAKKAAPAAAKKAAPAAAKKAAPAAAKKKAGAARPAAKPKK
jgi:DNA-binding protein HU-beta